MKVKAFMIGVNLWSWLNWLKSRGLLSGNNQMRRKIMLNKTFTLLALILLSIIFLATCDITPPPKNKKKAVFIFCDVTGSLIKEESEQVAKLTADILDRLEPEAVFKRSE